MTLALYGLGTVYVEEENSKLAPHQYLESSTLILPTVGRWHRWTLTRVCQALGLAAIRCALSWKPATGCEWACLLPRPKAIFMEKRYAKIVWLLSPVFSAISSRHQDQPWAFADLVVNSISMALDQRCR